MEARRLVDRPDLDAAIPLIANALRRFGGSDHDAVWGLRVLDAYSLCHTKGWKEAERALSRKLPPRLETSEYEARRLLFLTIAIWKNHGVPAGVAHGERARRTISRHRQLLGMWHSVMASMEGARKDRDRKDRDREEMHAEIAFRLAREAGDDVREVRALVDLTRVWTDKQKWSLVAREGEPALAKARELGLENNVQKILGNLGWLYLEIGDVDTAARYFTEAAEIAARVAKWDHPIWIAQIGAIHLQRGEYEAAAKAFRVAHELALAGNNDNLVVSTLEDLARLELARGQLQAAASFAGQAQEKQDGERGKIVRARIATASGNYEQALSLLQLLTRSRTRPVKWEAEGRLAQLYARMGRPAEAEEHFHIAIDTARAARGSIEENELRFAFFHVIDDIFDSYIKFLVDTNRAATALLATERLRAQTLLEGEAPAAQLDLFELARQRNASILCYWLGDEHSYMWLVTSREVKIRRLPPAKELNALVDRYQQLTVGTGTLSSMTAQGRRLYQLLVAPAKRDLVRGGRVIVVPDGRLHELNFETLVVPDTRAARFFIEDAVVMNASSLQLLARTPRVRSRTRSMLLVGDPSRAEDRYPALPHADKEIRMVAERFAQPTVLDDVHATPAAYHAATPGAFEFIHFVAHAEAAQQKPLDSAVILARDATGRYRLEAREIVKDPLAARLVTISSCHGAGKRAYVGEGLVGLAWAFLGAGAQQVVAALWEVNDAATPRLMDDMYAGIRAGRDPAVALRDAKLRLLRSRTVHKRPYYWAPFVLYAGS